MMEKSLRSCTATMDECRRRAKRGQPTRTPWTYCSSSQSVLLWAFCRTKLQNKTPSTRQLRYCNFYSWKYIGGGGNNNLVLVPSAWLATNRKGCSAGKDLMMSAATCNWWSVNLLSQLWTYINMLYSYLENTQVQPQVINIIIVSINLVQPMEAPRQQ